MADSPLLQLLSYVLHRSMVARAARAGRLREVDGLTVFLPGPPSPGGVEADGSPGARLLQAVELLRALAPRTFRRLVRHAAGGVRDGVADAYLYRSKTVSLRLAPDVAVEPLAANLAFAAGLACASARWSDRADPGHRERGFRAGCGEKSRLYLRVAKFSGASPEQLQTLADALRDECATGTGADQRIDLLTAVRLWKAQPRAERGISESSNPPDPRP